MDTSFLKEYAQTRGYMLGRPQKPKISPDGKTVLFLRADPKTPKMKLFEFDVATGKTKELLSPEMLLKGGEENLTPEEKARRERQRVTVGGFTDFHLDKEGKHILVMLAGKLYVFDRAAGKATELKTGEGGAIVDPKWSPDGKKVAYVRGFDVYVYDLAAGKESAVTKGGTATKTHGLAEFVAQEEMGRLQRLLVEPGRQAHRLRGGGPHRRRDVVDRRPAEARPEAGRAVLPAARQEERRGEARHHPRRGRQDGVGRVGPREVRVPGKGRLGRSTVR